MHLNKMEKTDTQHGRRHGTARILTPEYRPALDLRLRIQLTRAGHTVLFSVLLQRSVCNPANDLQVCNFIVVLPESHCEIYIRESRNNSSVARWSDV